jgi:FkbM family methyltransferase
MFDKLRHLKALGYEPDTIFDIGAHHGNWTISMKSIYPKSQYFLFEAIDYPQLKQFERISSISVHTTLLNDTAKEVEWFQMKNTGDSMFREKTFHFDHCEVLKRQSIDLDSYAAEKGMLEGAKNIFVKIDCQGAEIPILKGATSLYEKTDFILLELPFFGQYNTGVPTFLEHIQFMDSIGFVPFDIVDTHPINGFTMQLDVLFIHKKHPFCSRVNDLLLKRQN